MELKDKRPEKLASAIYLVTSFFNDQEPIKWRLRGLSADLISESAKDKILVVREILSLFSLARTVGLVSEANHDILAGQLSRFRQETENSLDTVFHPEIVAQEKILPQPGSTEYIKDNLIDKTTVEKPSLKEFGSVSVKKSSRQSTIIAIMKRKKEVMIKDISPLIGGCSEKTIQRELSAMVQAGVLKKVGEKRWSRYLLA